MAAGIAVHINYNDFSLSHVTWVSGYRLCISKISPASINDVDAVNAGIVFRTNTSAELKSYLTALLAAMVSAKSNGGYAYLTSPVAIGADYLGDGQAFYHTGNVTTHLVIKQLLSPSVVSPRFMPYQFEINLDGYYNDSSSDCDTFYDDLTTKKNLLW